MYPENLTIMNRFIRTGIGFLLTLICFNASAQSDSLCRKQLKELFDGVHSLTTPGPGLVGKLKYSVFVKGKGDKKDKSEVVDLEIGNKFFSVKSQNTAMVSDSAVQIVIYHPQKYILIAHPQTEGMKDNKMEQLKAFQSNIITTAKEVVCTEGGYKLKTSLDINNYEVEAIEYFAEDGASFFHSSVIRLKDNADIEYLEYKILEFSLAKEKTDPPSVWHAFKDHKGKIKDEFNTFSIVDLRKTKDGI